MSNYYVSAKKDSFGHYLTSIGRYDILTKEQEYAYGTHIQRMMECLGIVGEDTLTEEEAAARCNVTLKEYKQILQKGAYYKNKMFNHNLKLVVFIARRYNNRGVDIEDLVQEGNLGLGRAVEKFNPELGYKFSTYACVPTTTEILTQRGWLKWNEVRAGDKTLGYNPQTQASEWTEVTAVTNYPNAPLHRFGDGRWSTLCTPNHKWLMQDDNETSLRPIEEWPTGGENCRRNSAVKLVLSAPFIGGSSPLTEDEARVVAWALSVDYTGTGAVSIYLSELELVENLRGLLQRLNLSYTESAHKGLSNCRRFCVEEVYLQKVWNKANLHKSSPQDLVLDLTPSARRAFNETWYHSRGLRGKSCIAESGEDKLSFLSLSLFLDGRNCVKQVKNDRGFYHQVWWRDKLLTPQRCGVTPAGEGPVWCPSTRLESWTARDENGNIFLTGNTWWIRQSIIRAVANQSRTIRLPVHVYDLLNRIKKAERSLLRDLGRPARASDIAEEVNIKMDKLQALGYQSKKVWSLDSDRYNTDDSPALTESYLDTDREKDNIFQRDMQDKTEMLLDMLTEQDRAIISRRFGLEEHNVMSYKAIAEELGLSCQFVRTAHFRICKNLKTLCAELEIDFFDSKLANY